MGRSELNGVMIIPELYKITDSKLEHKATRYRVYDNRIMSNTLLDVTVTDDRKKAYEYKPPLLYDDMEVYFSTNILLEDNSWVGDSPLTKAILRRDRDVNDSVIVTPEAYTSGDIRINGITLSGSPYVAYTGKTKHMSTDFIVEEELTGKVIFERLRDEVNLTSIFIDKKVFTKSRAFRLKIRYWDELGRCGNFGTVMFTTYNILDILSDVDSFSMDAGSTITLKATGSEVLFDTSKLYLDVYTQGKFRETLVYGNTGFVINGKKYVSGDKLNCVCKYFESRRDVTINIITPSSTEVEVDEAYTFTGVHTDLAATNFLLSGVSTSFQNIDGTIYDIDYMNSTVVTVKFNALENKLSVDKVVLDLSSVIDSTYTYRTFIKSPIGGIIIVVATNTGIGGQKLLFVTEGNDGLILDSVMNLSHDLFSITHNSTYYIQNGRLYMHNREQPNTPKTRRIISVNVVNRTVTTEGYLSVNGLSLRNFIPVFTNDKVLMFQPGLGADGEGTLAGLKPTDVTGDAKWAKSVYNPNNNKIYYTPQSTGDIMIYDCNIDEFVFIPSGETGENKWIGCCYNSTNNKIYFAPFNSNNIMVLDCEHETVSKIVSGETVGFKWYDCTYNPTNDKVYFSPYNSNNILILNCADDTKELLPSGYTGTAKFTGCTYNPVDDTVYFTPHSNQNILKLECSTKTKTSIDTNAAGLQRWASAVHHLDSNKMYFIPHTNPNILVLDCDTGSVSMVTSGHTGGSKWATAVYNPIDNKIYCAPYNNRYVLVIECGTNVVSTIDTKNSNTGKWFGTAYNSEDNRIYLGPYNHDSIAILELATTQTVEDVIRVTEHYNGTVEPTKLGVLPEIEDSHLISRVYLMKNGKVGILYAPSTNNDIMGVVEVDPNTYATTDKTMTYTATRTYRIVYYLNDGSLIVADTDRAVLLK